jgi:hypothetical protein
VFKFVFKFGFEFGFGFGFGFGFEVRGSEASAFRSHRAVTPSR